MRVAVTRDAAGLHEALADALVAAGDETLLLVEGRPGPWQRHWQPDAGRIDVPGLDDVDAVVNLVDRWPLTRWTPASLARLAERRANALLTIVSALDPGGRCQRLVTLSSTLFYGDRGADPVTTATARGAGPAAAAVAAWEAGTRHVAVPTALARTPHVLTRSGGYLAQRRGLLAGRLGSGEQWVPWIHVDDWARALVALVHGDDEGPVNICAPEPVLEADFARALAAGRRLPTFGVPEGALRVLLGAGTADALHLASTRVEPRTLQQEGFTWRFPTLGPALADCVGRVSL